MQLKIPVFLFENADLDGLSDVELREAYRSTVVDGSLFQMEYRINNRIGEVLWQGTADNSGYLLVKLKPGIYTVEIKAADYETMFYTVVANPLLDASVYEFYATGKLNTGEYAIVLTWGEYPYDLDSHLFTTVGTVTEHI